MFCDKCGKSLMSDQRFCPGCGTPAPPESAHAASTQARSGLANPKVPVLIIAVVLIAVAFGTLHPHSALIACLCITIAAFAIFSRAVRLRTKLIAMGGALAFVLLLNGIEGWQERQGQLRQEELAKQQAASDVAQKQRQEEAFRQLSPKEHLDKARLLLQVGSPQPSINEGLKNLDAIPTSAPEFTDGKLLRRQFDAAKKKTDEEQARIQATAAFETDKQKYLKTARKKYTNDLEALLREQGFDAVVTELGDTLIVANDLFKDEGNRVQFLASIRGKNSQGLCQVGFRRVALGGTGVFAGTHSYSLECR